MAIADSLQVILQIQYVVIAEIARNMIRSDGAEVDLSRHAFGRDLFHFQRRLRDYFFADGRLIEELGYLVDEHEFSREHERLMLSEFARPLYDLFKWLGENRVIDPREVLHFVEREIEFAAPPGMGRHRRRAEWLHKLVRSFDHHDSGPRNSRKAQGRKAGKRR
jgi:hypothetical protein